VWRWITRLAEIWNDKRQVHALSGCPQLQTTLHAAICPRNKFRGGTQGHLTCPLLPASPIYDMIYAVSMYNFLLRGETLLNRKLNKRFISQGVKADPQAIYSSSAYQATSFFLCLTRGRKKNAIHTLVDDKHSLQCLNFDKKFTIRHKIKKFRKRF